MAFALVLNAILLLALFTLAPRPEPKRVDDRMPVTFDVETGQKSAEQQERAPKAERREKEDAAAPKQAEAVVRPPVPVAKPAEQPPSPFPFLTLNREQMASADIGRMPKAAQGASAAGQGNSAAVAGPGEGPGGVQLYVEDWFRPPTNAQLSAYLPSNAPAQGYGLIACKTIDHYHVENCQTLGEYPLGSGFAKAARLAAWQFLIKPPRVNGKVLVGAWVRIRIDYTRTMVSAGPGAGGE